MADQVIVFCGTGILETLGAWMQRRPEVWLSVNQQESAIVPISVNKGLKAHGYKGALGFFHDLDGMKEADEEPRYEGAFSGSYDAFRPGGSGRCESLNAVVDRMSSDSAGRLERRYGDVRREEWWDASIETKILEGYRSEVCGPSDHLKVVLVSADRPSNRWANAVICRLLERHDWNVERVIPLDAIQRGLGINGQVELLRAIRPILMSDTEGSKSDVLLAGGYKDLHRVVAQLAPRAYGLNTWQLLDEAPWAEPGLQKVGGPSASDHKTVTSLIDDIMSEPAEVYLDRSGQISACSRDALDRMDRRAKQWQVNGLWRGGLTTYMIEHGASHGRHVDRISDALFRVSTVADGLDGSHRDLAFEVLSAAAWLADIGMRPTKTDAYTVDDPAHLLLARGILSEKFIVENSEALGLAHASEENFALLVGALCRFRMPTARLRSEVAEDWNCPFESAACRPCPQLHRAGTSENLWSVAADLGVLPPDVVVAMGAVLRLADTADIGVHRVSPYWDTIGAGRTTVDTRRVHDVWFREQIWEYLASLPDRLRGAIMDAGPPSYGGTPEMIPSEIDRRFVNAAKRDLSEAETREVVGRLGAIERSFADQSEHVRRNQVISRVEVVSLGPGEITLRLAQNSEWLELKSHERSETFDAITDDIFREYTRVREFLNAVGIKLTRVEGPDDLSRIPEDCPQGAVL